MGRRSPVGDSTGFSVQFPPREDLRSFGPAGTQHTVQEIRVFVAELCVLRTFGGVDFSLTFICTQSVPDFLWDRLRASIQFYVIPKRAQYARFSGECATIHMHCLDFSAHFWFKSLCAIYVRCAVLTKTTVAIANNGTEPRPQRTSLPGAPFHPHDGKLPF